MKHLALKPLFFIALALITTLNSVQAQVVVNDNMTVEQLVNEIILGGDIEATNITYNGLSADSIAHQVGGFTVDSSAFPLAEGVVISAAAATEISGVFGPFTQGGYSNDLDLFQITGVNMYNCASIEFDFVANTDTFLIDYIFSSHEYASYTCSNYNDAFGIFLSGPGISGPFSNNAKNIALIPNSNTPVAINTVNSGSPSVAGYESICLEANPNYVADSIYFFNNNPQMENSISHGGHTNMFTAFAELIPGEEYHFKYAIGNALDQYLSSAAMIRKGGINSSPDQNELVLEVNTEGIDVAPEGIYIAGTFNYFIPEPMEQVGENYYRFSTLVSPFVNVTYKFFNGSGANAGELIPDECSIQGTMPNGTRFLTMQDAPISVETVCFGTCNACPGVLSIHENPKEIELSLYPNPTSDGVFQILAPKDGFARIQAYDLQGKMRLDKRVYLNNGNPISFELPSKGLFKVRVYYEDLIDSAYSAAVVVE